MVCGMVAEDVFSETMYESSVINGGSYKDVALGHDGFIEWNEGATSENI